MSEQPSHLGDEVTSLRRSKDSDHTPSPHSEQELKNYLSEPTSENNAHDNDSDTTGTNSSDEFDWDEDDGLTGNGNQASPKARRGRALWLAFMKLARPVRTLLVGVLGAGILISPLLVVELKYKDKTSVRPQVHAWSLWLSITWAAGCATYLIVDAIPRLAISLLVLYGAQVESLKTQIELALAVSGWVKLALDISWAWIALSAIRAFYKPPGSYWVIINRVMQALFTAGIILLAEKLFLHFVAISFHQKALADRLAENRLGLKTLDRLSNAQPTLVKKDPYSKKGHKSALSSFGTSLDLHGMQRRRSHHDEGQDGQSSAGGSPLIEKSEAPATSTIPVLGRLKSIRAGHAERKRRRRKVMASIIVDHLGGAIGQVALKNSRFHRDGDLGGLHSARRLAMKLFSVLSDVNPPRSHLVVEDFYPYFRTTAEAHAAFAIFDQDANGDISKREMRESVQRIYRERKALVTSLKDVDSVVAKLDAVLIAIALLGILFACLLIFNRSNTLASLVPLATIILGFSFIFGHSAQTLFESLIFIFSTHVFDVGDLVMIDDQALYVREFGLFSTTFRRTDGQEIIAPNAILASTKLVHNLRRSNSMWESTTLMISYNTSLEIVEQLKQRIQAYIAQNSREWSGCGVSIDKMEYQNAIHLTISVEHRPNWQDWGGRWARRNAFMRNLKTILEELDIRYTKPVQPVLMPNPPTSGSRSH